VKETSGGNPQVVIIATGSEVSIAMEALGQLDSQDLKGRVVSMPSWELFDAQSEVYRNSVLPPEIPRLAIEAGVSLAWGRYVDRSQGHVMGIDRYGASAPYKTIFEHYGLTAERVVEQVKKLVG
jgi:transketolase